MKERTKEKIISTSKILLMTVGVVGLLSVAVVAPNMIKVLKYFGVPKDGWKIKTFRLNREIKRLVEKGHLEIKEDQTHKFLKITEKGKRELLKIINPPLKYII